MATAQDPVTLEGFCFRTLHPRVFLGTASDRYAGWIGQIYSADRYARRITKRAHVVGGTSFQDEVLPVDSVEQYFEHFRVLELDFTFYRPLLDVHGEPTQNFHTLTKYRRHLAQGNLLLLKVPQTVFAQKILKDRRYVENAEYLDSGAFVRRFYEPAVNILGDHLAGFIFEQEYQRTQNRCPPEKLAKDLDAFFGAIPRDTRYHMELRTERYLSTQIFSLMEKYGVGQVLSHWTWLPSLRRQFSLSGERIINAGGHCVVRLLTPRGMRYEEAYARAHPFDKIVDSMLDPRMIEDTVELMRRAIDQKAHINVIVNNRAGGNAPLIAQKIAKEFLSASE